MIGSSVQVALFWDYGFRERGFRVLRLRMSLTMTGFAYNKFLLVCT